MFLAHAVDGQPAGDGEQRHDLRPRHGAALEERASDRHQRALQGLVRLGERDVQLADDVRVRVGVRRLQLGTHSLQLARHVRQRRVVSRPHGAERQQRVPLQPPVDVVPAQHLRLTDDVVGGDGSLRQREHLHGGRRREDKRYRRGWGKASQQAAIGELE